MHKDDQMTPVERLTAFMSGQPMDRLLAIPVVCSMSGKACGMTHKVKRSTAENEAAAQIACYERFGNDMLLAEYGLHGVGIVREFRYIYGSSTEIWKVSCGSAKLELEGG